MPEMLRWLILAAGLCAAAYTDVKKRKIPNRITVPMAALGFLISLCMGPIQLEGSLWGFLLGLGLGFVFWILSIIRAGDAKLFAAMGALCGSRLLLNCLSWAILIAAVFGVVILIKEGVIAASLCPLL